MENECKYSGCEPLAKIFVLLIRISCIGPGPGESMDGSEQATRGSWQFDFVEERNMEDKCDVIFKSN
jgi:hypothetical protein